jgi:hypothetical protein
MEWSKKQREPSCTLSKIPSSTSRPSDGERTVFPTNGAGKAGCPHAKPMKLDPFLMPKQKLSQNSIKTPN